MIFLHYPQGREHWREVRKSLQYLLDAETSTLRDNHELRSRCLIPMSKVKMYLPVTIGDYTDFYSSLEHAIWVYARAYLERN